MTDAREFNRRQVERGVLTIDHVTTLVRHWQATHDLDDDGKAGPKTIGSIERSVGLVPPSLLRWCWPMRRLEGGRTPTITSGFRNPDRRNHSGVDIMYRYERGDPPMRVGDGGRTAQWWVPEGTHALAVADGVVEIAGKTATGWRVWIRHEGDYASGYFHLSQLFVGLGETVALGASVGIVGDNPSDYDPDHLHFELVRGDLDNLAANRIDPALILKGAEILEAA